MPLSSNPSADHQTRSRPLSARSPSFDSTAQLGVIQDSLLETEQLYGVYASNTPGIALVGVTNRRLILLDTAFPGGRTALITVPFSRVTTVSYVSTDAEPIFSATLAIQVARTYYEVTCRTEQQASDLHDLVTYHLLDL